MAATARALRPFLALLAGFGWMLAGERVSAQIECDICLNHQVGSMGTYHAFAVIYQPPIVPIWDEYWDMSGSGIHGAHTYLVEGSCLGAHPRCDMHGPGRGNELAMQLEAAVTEGDANAVLGAIASVPGMAAIDVSKRAIEVGICGEGSRYISVPDPLFTDMMSRIRQTASGALR